MIASLHRMRPQYCFDQVFWLCDECPCNTELTLSSKPARYPPPTHTHIRYSHDTRPPRPFPYLRHSIYVDMWPFTPKTTMPALFLLVPLFFSIQHYLSPPSSLCLSFPQHDSFVVPVALRPRGEVFLIVNGGGPHRYSRFGSTQPVPRQQQQHRSKRGAVSSDRNCSEGDGTVGSGGWRVIGSGFGSSPFPSVDDYLRLSVEYQLGRHFL